MYVFFHYLCPKCCWVIVIVHVCGVGWSFSEMSGVGLKTSFLSFIDCIIMVIWVLVCGVVWSMAVDLLQLVIYYCCCWFMSLPFDYHEMCVFFSFLFFSLPFLRF